MTALTVSRTEPHNIRRGFEWRIRLQIFVENAEGDLVPQSLSGFTITGKILVADSKDSTAVASVTVTTTTVDTASGRFDISINQTDTALLTVGVRYFYMVYANHATITGGKDEMVRMGAVEVPA